MRLDPGAGVLSARLEARVAPQVLVGLLDDGAAMVWSDPGGSGTRGFLGLIGDRDDVVLLDGDDRVLAGAGRALDVAGTTSATGLDRLTGVLRARLARSSTRSPLLGWWGWLGYEAGARALRVPFAAPDGPTAAFALVDRGVQIDGPTGELTLLVDAQAPDAERWLAGTAARVAGAVPGLSGAPLAAGPARRRLDRAAYLDRINACLAAITRGDAYQLCLTTTVDIELPAAFDPLAAYARLRRASPAPYGGVLRIGDRWLLSASPERFLTVDTGGRAATSPIKGTRPRHEDPVQDRALAVDLASDEKERAENVMIVDLCRNDLSQVSQIGSVQVSELFAVQSHPQVHQLVSTVES
ncbi:MAG: chorismate-binding protein, partial [Cellulomonas sp.]|nr:chorismate-binding protein [Cellulomonas sp.]